jgi:hypothetical protein
MKLDNRYHLASLGEGQELNLENFIFKRLQTVEIDINKQKEA